MNIVFLDVDGVLNSWDKMLKHDARKGCDYIYKEYILRLKDLCEKYDLKIVLSSTWRISDRTHKIFEDYMTKYGLIERYIGDTPRSADRTKYGRGKHRRGDEIHQWMLDCKEGIEAFVILDDGSDMKEYLPHLAQSTLDTGFTEETYKIACEVMDIQIQGSKLIEQILPKHKKELY